MRHSLFRPLKSMHYLQEDKAQKNMESGFSIFSQNTMKHNRTLISLCSGFLLLLFAFSNTQAGDYSALNVIGFSKDGKFLAFEEYGTQDGSGFPYVNVYFINVEKNSYASQPYSLIVKNENSTESAARNKARLDTEKKLQELRIIRGNMGKHVLSRFMTDLTINGDRDDIETAPDELRFAEEIGSMYQRGDYSLKLTPTEAKSKECEAYEMPVLKFELTLLNNETQKNTILQKDDALPKSRGCAIRYRAQDVFLYEGNVAVFISVFTPGFEGPDMRFMVVTGKLA